MSTLSFFREVCKQSTERLNAELDGIERTQREHKSFKERDAEPPQEQTVADNPLLHVDDDSSDICEECGHLIGLHKVDGCEGDRNIEVEEGFEMSGACGCQAYTTDDGSGYAYSREFNSKP